MFLRDETWKDISDLQLTQILNQGAHDASDTPQFRGFGRLGVTEAEFLTHEILWGEPT